MCKSCCGDCAAAAFASAATAAALLLPLLLLHLVVVHPELPGHVVLLQARQAHTQQGRCSRPYQHTGDTSISNMEAGQLLNLPKVQLQQLRTITASY
jgi:hypothetical protein